MFPHEIYNLITTYIAEWGYLGIIITMAIESACIPLPSEVVMPFSGFFVSTGHMSFSLVVLSGTIGNLLGSLATYYAGCASRNKIHKKILKYKIFQHGNYLQKAEKMFVKYGIISVFLGRLMPGVRTFISFPAGVAKMDLKLFITYTVAGSAIWCVLLTYIGFKMGAQWEQIEYYFGLIHEYMIFAFTGLLIAVGIILFSRYKKSFTTKKP